MCAYVNSPFNPFGTKPICCDIIQIAGSQHFGCCYAHSVNESLDLDHIGSCINCRRPCLQPEITIKHRISCDVCSACTVKQTIYCTATIFLRSPDNAIGKLRPTSINPGITLCFWSSYISSNCTIYKIDVSNL